MNFQSINEQITAKSEKIKKIHYYIIYSDKSLKSHYVKIAMILLESFAYILLREITDNFCDFIINLANALNNGWASKCFVMKSSYSRRNKENKKINAKRRRFGYGKSA